MNINPWINFNGNAEEAFNFYKTALGGEITKTVRFADIAGPEVQIAENEKNKLMMITLKLGSGQMLIANDVPEMLGPVSENENRSKILVNTDSKEEADRIFKGLSDGGAIEGPMGDSPWGSYVGTFRDKYGIEWLIEFAAKSE